jgi:hypothetical protein
VADNRVDQVTVENALAKHERRIGILEADVGRWVYVLPMAPSTPPASFNAADPLSPPFQNSWGNIAGQQPVSFRLWPASKVQIRGAIAGGTLPSVVFTLPAGYRPPQPQMILFPSIDGSTAYTGRVDVSGEVWVLAVIAVGPSPGPGPGPGAGIFFDIPNVGDSLSVATTDGTFFTDNGSGGIGLLSSPGATGGLTFRSFAGIEIDERSAAGISIATIAGGGPIAIQSVGGISIENDAAANTHIFNTAAGALVIESLGSGGTQIADGGAGGLTLLANGSTKMLLQSIAGMDIEDTSGFGVFIAEFGAGGITLSDSGSGGIIFDMSGSSGFIEMVGLPIANPGGTNRVWNNGGVLNIT